MTERERLIELIREAMKNHEITIENYVIPTSDYIADYLLENNVKPLPFKIDDIVYGISMGKIIPIQIDTIQYTKRGIDTYGSHKEYFGYGTIYLDVNNQKGIQWYKTKEEAEKSLKGGIENENHNRNT